MSKTDSLISTAQQEAIVAAIKAAENNTSGEIRVHIEAHTDKPTMERAIEVFHSLDMHHTAAQNGVLFYIALTDRTFAIIGDKGIDAVVPKDFWESVKTQVISKFKEEAFTDGLILGISATGEKLKQFFPFQKDDKNELSDAISIGK